MNPFEMVAVIVIVVMIARVMRDRYRAQAMTQPPISDDMRMMADELARLRERVQVLERVITDDHSGHDLASRIDRLRDH